MKRFCCVVVLLAIILGCALNTANAATEQEIYDRIQFLNQQISEMTANSVYSNVYVDSSWIDLSQVSATGSVVQYTYRSGNPAPAINSFTITLRSFDSALDKVVRYVLGNVANVYRQEPLNTEITMITHQRTTVPIYVYGDYKVQALDEIILGLPNCFNISYDTSSGRSKPTEPIPMPVAESILNAIFSINSNTVSVSGSSSSEPATIIMDVTPEIVDNRTFVPVRFLAYALGVPEEGVTWEQETQQVSIIKEETTISLTIGSNIMTVNNEPVEMDVVPYIKQVENGGRTMLPARWVAEPLGATVTWDESTQQVTIEIPQSQEQEQG